MNKFIQSIRNASGAAHTIVVIGLAAAALYNTNPHYKAEVQLVWTHLPRWIQMAIELIGPPALIYWNTRKAQGQQAGKTEGQAGK